MTPVDLKPYQVKVLRLAAEGLKNREIGQRLGISEGAARQHLYRVNKALGSCSRIQAIAIAYRAGLLDGVAA